MAKSRISDWIVHYKKLIKYRMEFGFAYEGGFFRYVFGNPVRTIPALPAPAPFQQTAPTAYQMPATTMIPSATVQPQALPVSAPVQTIQQHPVERAFLELDIVVRVTEDFSGQLLDVVSIIPARGVRGNAIAGAATDLARILGVQSVRVVPNGIHAGGKVGTMVLEISRCKSTRRMVWFEELIKSPEWRNTNAKLPVIIGVDVRGKIVIGDIAKFPHAIIGGQTGGGKTAWIKTMLMGLALRLTPKHVQFIIISPKPQSYLPFANMPHLAKPVVTDMIQAARELNDLVIEMNRRFALFTSAGCEHITEYNAKVSLDKRVPAIIYLNDEVAAMMSDLKKAREKAKEEYARAVRKERERARLEKREPDEVEEEEIPDPTESILQLTRMARESGIHCLFCTQLPYVSSISGEAKGNCPTRIGFLTENATNSISILSQGGAEKLMGEGDMLYSENGGGALRRVHGSFIDNPEIKRLMGGIKP